MAEGTAVEGRSAGEGINNIVNAVSSSNVLRLRGGGPKKSALVQTPCQQTVQLNAFTSEEAADLVQMPPSQEEASERVQKSQPTEELKSTGDLASRTTLFSSTDTSASRSVTQHSSSSRGIVEKRKRDIEEDGQQNIEGCKESQKTHSSNVCYEKYQNKAASARHDSALCQKEALKVSLVKRPKKVIELWNQAAKQYERAACCYERFGNYLIDKFSIHYDSDEDRVADFYVSSAECLILAAKLLDQAEFEKNSNQPASLDTVFSIETSMVELWEKVAEQYQQAANSYEDVAGSFARDIRRQIRTAGNNDKIRASKFIRHSADFRADILKDTAKYCKKAFEVERNPITHSQAVLYREIVEQCYIAAKCDYQNMSQADVLQCIDDYQKKAIEAENSALVDKEMIVILYQKIADQYQYQLDTLKRNHYSSYSNCS